MTNIHSNTPPGPNLGHRRTTTGIAALVALSFIAAACGSDKSTSSASTAAPTAASTAGTTAGSTAESTAASTAETTAASTAETTAASAAETTAGSTADSGATTPFDLDTNGDGKIVIGVATPGPRNDGAYYQALVDGVTAFSKAHGFEAPIIVDNIKAEEAESQLDALARQNVDMIAVGAGELGDPLAALTKKYDKIVWYCNCGAGHEALPNLIQSGDDGSEMGYSAGVATGLLMKAKGVTKAAMIGNNNFNFEVEAFLSFKLGLASIDASYEWTYVATNSFNDVAAATEAFNNLKDQGVGAIWPYLGGALEPVVKLSNEAGIITMSAGSSKACASTTLKYDIAVRFDAGDYLDTILTEILDGKLKRGETRAFHVGVDPQGGAVICNPTADETTAMAKAYKDIADGSLAAQFGEIKGKAYAP